MRRWKWAGALFACAVCMLGMSWDAEQYRIQASLIGRNGVWQQDHGWRQERRLRAASQVSMSQVNSDRVLSPCELRSPTTFCYLAFMYEQRVGSEIYNGRPCLFPCACVRVMQMQDSEEKKLSDLKLLLSVEQSQVCATFASTDASAFNAFARLVF